MPAWFVLPAIQMAAQFAQNWANRSAANAENRMNRENTDIAYNRQMELLKYQLDYNNPAAQMARFKQAGLNPNLIYGQGSPGNMQNAPEVPKAAPVRRQPLDMSQMMQIPMQMMQLKMMKAQTDLTEAKTDESGYKQELIQAQTAVQQANPYLAPGYVQNLASIMESNARIKKQEADWKLSESQQIINGQPTGWAGPAKGVMIMEQQLRALEQRFNLGQADQKIKAEILQSKEFLNAFNDIQLDWLKNAELTPEHLRQGFMMFLQMLMRK